MHHESSVVVNRPIDEVWTFMTDPFNIPRSGGGRLAFRVTPTGPWGLGSTIQQRMVIFGFETRITSTVTEWDPPRTVTHSVMDSGIVRSGVFRATLEAAGAGTKVVRAVEVEPRGILKLLSPVLGPFMRRQMDAQTQNLKRLLEAGQG